ncbi:MAG: DUF1993 domain-containing protein [Burkholderiaceae bacterium]
MSTNLYDVTVPVFTQMLGNLTAILDKAAAHAEAKKIDPAVLLSARLFPDMFPLTRQVQIACDFARGGVSRLAGAEPDKWEDNEATIEALKARIANTQAAIARFGRDAFAAATEREIELKLRGEPVRMNGLAYLNRMVLPNFYFHTTTAYDILRHNGVELGKRDFIGALP